MTDLYEYILRSGTAGYTDAELRKAFDLSVDAVRHRRTRLVQIGKVITHRFRRRNPSGRRAMVWVASKVINTLNKKQAFTKDYRFGKTTSFLRLDARSS